MAREPRTRPFRIGLMTLFITFAVVYVGCVIRGIVTSLLHQGALPPPVAQGDCRRTLQSCGDGLHALQTTLDQTSCDLERAGTQAERRWDEWITQWQRDLTSLRAECCLGEAPPAERAPLARTATDLEKLGRLYTTQMVQYAHEIGPTAERCAGDLAVIPMSVPAPSNSPGRP